MNFFAKDLYTIVSYIITMETTIQVSRELLEKLAIMKMREKESYENVIWDLIEDRMEFSNQTKRNIEQSEKEIKEGKIVSLKKIKEKLKA